MKQNECQFILEGLSVSYLSDIVGECLVVGRGDIRKKGRKGFTSRVGGALCPKCGAGIRKVAYEKLGIV